MKPRTLTDHAVAWYRKRRPALHRLTDAQRAEALKQFTQYINTVTR